MIVNQIWNPSLHRELVREDLHFLKLAFGPVFPRDEILNALPSSLAKQKIRSYAIYETTGVWDFFVRAWIPHDILVEQVIKEISATLPGAVTVTDWQSGTVTDILKHWVWEQDGHRWCYHSDEFNKNDAVLRSRLDAESISKTNHKNLSDDSYQELRRLGLVSRMSPTSGIKFIIEIPTVGTLESAQGFAKTVLDIVNGANEIKEKSCYALNGFAAFLIIGRVSERKFQRVHDQLLNAINRAGLSNLLRARTRTHIVIHSPSEPGYYQDHLPVELLSLQEPEPSLGELLQKAIL